MPLVDFLGGELAAIGGGGTENDYGVDIGGVAFVSHTMLPRVNKLGLAYGVGSDGGMVLNMFPDATIG